MNQIELLDAGESNDVFTAMENKPDFCEGKETGDFYESEKGNTLEIAAPCEKYKHGAVYLRSKQGTVLRMAKITSNHNSVIIALNETQHQAWRMHLVQAV